MGHRDASSHTRHEPPLFDEDTLTDHDARRAVPRGRGPRRELCFLDFKDGRTGVAVTHGPIDPSRIWITLRSGDAVLRISFEEDVGRQIAAGLASVLPTFRAVRSDLRRT